MDLTPDLFECCSRTGDFGEDFFGGFGPEEGLWVGIVVFQVVVNGGFELGNGGEDAATDALLSDQPEDALDLIEPGGRGWGEVQVKAGVLGQPLRWTPNVRQPEPLVKV